MNFRTCQPGRATVEYAARLGMWHNASAKMPDETEAQRRLLLVEDEDKVARSVAKGLREEGYHVTIAGTARSAEALLDRAFSAEGAGEGGKGYDLLIVDWMLPDGDGLLLAQRCRGHGTTVPILMLTAKDAISDRVTGLEAGADDYLVKPFAFAELVARVRALLRRSQGKVASVRIGDVEIDLTERVVRRGGQPAALPLAAQPRGERAARLGRRGGSGSGSA